MEEFRAASKKLAISYFGPVSAANKFFSSNGFPCPSLQNPPDHFEEDPEKGLARGLTTEKAIHILVASYDSSEISHQVHKEIAQMNKRLVSSDIEQAASTLDMLNGMIRKYKGQIQIHDVSSKDDL
ncbi:hypothetical protein HN51_024610 [Arachis hypogaea]